MAAKKKGRRITIEDLWAMKRFGAPTLSPDGTHACMAVTTYSMKADESTSQLWLLSTDGRVQRRLTRGPKDADPQWSPDGRWIAFTSRRATKDGGALEDDAQLYVIAADGGEAERVTDHPTGVASPRWFPDSRRLAFVSWVWPDEKSAKGQGKRVKADRDDKVKAYAIEHNNYRYWDHWFPRGRRAHLHVATLPTVAGRTGEGGLVGTAVVRDLFAGTAFHLPSDEPDAHRYDISPDGDEIAFTHDFDPDPKAPAFTDIVRMDVGTGRWTCPTKVSGRSEDSPRYSPDGRWIAMLSSDYARAHNEQARLALVATNDDAIVPLTFAWDRGVHGPACWTPDGARVVFLAETEVAQPVWSVAVPASPAVDPDVPRELVRGPRHGGVASDLAVARSGGAMVYARGSQSHPPALFACAADGTGERRIERFNDALLDELDLVDAHSMTVEGAHGDPVQMWVMTPHGFDRGDGKRDGKKGARRWPLMHSIHGGPHTCANDGWHWRWNNQLFAARGYVVAAVNYHGSTGWGQAYVESINGDWGWRELADVEAGTEALLATGRIDPARVYATGGSYGGYMVALMTGRAVRGRYAAYVCHAGCYDWVSMMGSDGYFWFGRELGAFPWEDEARVLAQSPHHYAAAFETPTLVIHGELDYRVPYYQALEYFNTLRVKGVPSRLLHYPDENHWILKPQNSRLWYREFFEWLERFPAKGEGRKKRAVAVASG